MVSSYQAPKRGDKERKDTVSQSQQSNLAAGHASVQNILDNKGDAVFSISPEDTLGQAVEVLSDKKIGALVVADGQGKLLGILSERDIVRKLAQMPGKTLPHKVEQVMTSSVETCTREESLISVLQRMTKGRFRHMPVVENDKLIGIVTIGDVVNNRLNELEYEALRLKQLVVG